MQAEIEQFKTTYPNKCHVTYKSNGSTLPKYRAFYTHRQGYSASYLSELGVVIRSKALTDFT